MNMRRIILVKFMAATTVMFAACANQNFLVPKSERASWRPVKDSTIANAPEAPPPKILPTTHLSAGHLFEAQGQMDKAIAQYRKAIAVSHQYTAAHVRLGLALSKVGRHEEAVDAFHRAAMLSPDNASIRNNLGYELMLRNRWADAERELQRAIDLNPRLERAHINLGITLAKQGKFEGALEWFLRVLPDSDAYYNLGLMYRAQRRYEDAAVAFERVLDLDPSFAAASAQLEQISPFVEPQPASPLVESIASTESVMAFTGNVDDRAMGAESDGSAQADTTDDGADEIAADSKREVRPTIQDESAIIDESDWRVGLTPQWNTKAQEDADSTAVETTITNSDHAVDSPNNAVETVASLAFAVTPDDSADTTDKANSESGFARSHVADGDPTVHSRDCESRLGSVAVVTTEQTPYEHYLVGSFDELDALLDQMDESDESDEAALIDEPSMKDCAVFSGRSVDSLVSIAENEMACWDALLAEVLYPPMIFSFDPEVVVNYDATEAVEQIDTMYIGALPEENMYIQPPVDEVDDEVGPVRDRRSGDGPVLGSPMEPLPN